MSSSFPHLLAKSATASTRRTHAKNEPICSARVLLSFLDACGVSMTPVQPFNSQARGLPLQAVDCDMFTSPKHWALKTWFVAHIQNFSAMHQLEYTKAQGPAYKAKLGSCAQNMQQTNCQRHYISKRDLFPTMRSVLPPSQ